MSQIRITVSKHDRRLTVECDGMHLTTYVVALGCSPEGDKEREGDGRTPEGEFYVCSRNDRSKFFLSLALSYPNKEDAARGLRDGLITREQHDRIASAIDSGKTPPWHTALGGEIYIHGGGVTSDWTKGCIALDNEDIRELFEIVPVGTPVVIQP